MDMTQEVESANPEMGDPAILDDAPGKISAEVEGYASETVNLVSTLTEEEQKKLGETVWEEGDADWRSSEKYRQHRSNILRLYLGMMPAKDEGYAQIHYPLIAKALQRLHARVYDQQFPSNGEFFGCAPTDATDLERCVRVAKHLNWQINHQIPEYVPNHDKLILQWYLYGSAFSYVYWDPIRNRPCHEACRTEDIILPYALESKYPDLSDMPRITRVLRKHRFGLDGLDALADSGYYYGLNVDAIFADKNVAGSDDVQASKPITDTVDKASGVKPPDGDARKYGPRVLWEQHRWDKLPGEKRYRPTVVTIDYDTKKLLCLKLREDEDPQDRARYNREKLAADTEYESAMQQYQADLAAYLANQPAPPLLTMTAPPIPGDVTATEPPQQGATDATAPLVDPNLPQPPPKPPEPAQPKMVPINFFTHYICIPNPEGVYGFGVGYLLEGNNVAADTMGSAMLDTAMLSNVPTGIRSRGSKLSGGEFKVKPGDIVEVDVPPEQLDKCIHLFKFPPPEPQLREFIRDMKEESDELSGGSDILSGEVGGSNETATTTQIRISQALAAISIQNKRYTRARTVEGQHFARLNSVHLGDNEYFPVIDPFKREPPHDQNIGRMDYLEDVDIIVTADPRMASQPQRVQEATNAVQLIMQSPVLSMNPTLVMAAYRNLFIAMDRPDLIAAMETPPPQPMGAPTQAGPPQPGQQDTTAQPPAKGNGSPRPAPTGPTVPHAGPAPANGQFMNQNT